MVRRKDGLYQEAFQITRNGRKIVPAGAIVPANGSTAKGVLYEDIDVTEGAYPGSIVTEGVIFEDMLPTAAVSDAKTALTGIVFKTGPSVMRPAIFGKLDLLTVESAASSSSTGKTALTVSGHTLATGESYVYKTNATAAPTVKLGQVLTNTDSWTAWDGDDEISSTTGHKITVAVINSDNEAVAAGSADVTVKAAG